jgi:hypothetical protein
MVPKVAAEGYREVKTAWMDIGGCGGTWFSPLFGKHNLLSKIWPSSMEGKILFVQGHVHEVSEHSVSYSLLHKNLCDQGRSQYDIILEWKADLHLLSTLR